jgi:nitrite reductase/ring-hydroxylating ferredoxin subunit
MTRVTVGTVADLEAKGFLTGKVGNVPLVVFRHDSTAYAIDDRCPHMGFPLHQGTVENGMVTCHWHHARFDLASGGTLDPWADDVRAYKVDFDGGDVVVTVDAPADRIPYLEGRIVEGLEQGLTLVIAKAVLGLLDAGVGAEDIVRLGVRFGTTYRAEGWGSGLTVLTAMANLLPELRPEDRALALVHGLAFLSNDTRNHAPRFPLGPLGDGQADPDRLISWYRRFIDTRSSDAAERALATAIANAGVDVAGRALVAAATDHVFLDEGHVIDFTNKALEVLAHVGGSSADAEPAVVLPTLVRMTARATRHEEQGAWRHPHDLASMVEQASERLPKLLAEGAGRSVGDEEVAALGWRLLADDPHAVVQALDDAIVAGANPEQLGRAVAFAAGLRITRFHTQNDHGDWDVVHHGFTAANGLHQLLVRVDSPELLRGVYHSALKVYLDRFLNVPAARRPETEQGDLAELQACWDEQGHVDRAGAIVHGFLAGGGDPREAIAALGGALLAEDPGFHWYQVIEAAVRQFHAWPAGSEEGRLILTGAARFLAAHTPTRRELPKVVRIATRLRRGEPLYEEEG